MIILEVEDYCHECPEFEADVESPTFIFQSYKKVCSGNTIVRCSNRRKCREIHSYFKRFAEKETLNEQN